MAFDGGLSGVGFAVPMDPNITDLDKLEDMQKQFVASLEDVATQMGVDPEQVRADAEQLAPYQPMMDFVEKWKGEDGLWTGDPVQRSQEYMDALSEMGQRSLGGLFSTLASASEQPPWDNPDTLSRLEGAAGGDQLTVAESAVDGKLESYRPETLPDGSVGYVEGVDPFWVQSHLDWEQGNAVPGFEGTCGLTSVSNLAQMYGAEVSEKDVVEFAAANGLCNTDAMNPGERGGSTPIDHVQLLGVLGIPAHVEQGGSLDDLVAYVENRQGVELGVNAGLLWDDSRAYDDGGPNHGITLTNVVRDGSGEVTGFQVCDSGKHDAPLDFISVGVMQKAWADTGGQCLVVDVQRTQGYPPGTPQGQLA